ncbi:MAG TPA: YebC/PmpR family DNA-binding transcriptional regulator [Candidatus Azoamicus sp.]
MAGHSKWSNIKHRKQSNDLKKSKLFSKLANDIRTSVSDSKSDINSNFKLKKAVDKALYNNMSKNAINHIISNLDHTQEVKNVYSAIGDNGISVIIECFDYNKNRMIGEIRCVLNQHNMSLVPFKSIEYTYLKGDKIFLTENYNDKFLYNYLDKLFLKKNFDNFVLLNSDLSKDIFFLLKKLDIKFEVSQVLYPKNIIKLDTNVYDKFYNMIIELKKLPYVANVFFNF